jgi:hypothetical protein
MAGIKKQEEEWLKKVIEDIWRDADSKGLSQFDGFKLVAKSVLTDTLKVLEDTEEEWELDHNSQELREKFHLLRHYLDYLKRFCEGRV